MTDELQVVTNQLRDLARRRPQAYAVVKGWIRQFHEGLPALEKLELLKAVNPEAAARIEATMDEVLRPLALDSAQLSTPDLNPAQKTSS